MDALDLRKTPPRGPRVPLAGLDLIMAARTVDKLRASLPGGNLGEYNVRGFSMQMLEAIGITEEAFRDEVARASDDAQIAAWIREGTTPEAIASFNEKIQERRVKDRLDDEMWRKKYPHAMQMPPETPLIDMLTKDDELTFLGAR